MSNIRAIAINAWDRYGFKLVIQLDASQLRGGVDLTLAARKFGLLPEPPEFPDVDDVGTVTEVVLRGTADGVPHIGFYHQNPGMEKRWFGHYLNQPNQRLEFEQRTGLRVADLPVYEGESHPTRGKRGTQKYFVSLPEPLLVVKVQKRWRGKDDEVQSQGYLKAYLGSANRSNGSADYDRFGPPPPDVDDIPY